MHCQPANDTDPSRVSERLHVAHPIHPVDEFVAAKIRVRREALNMSQRHLADQIGTTFQQVQKYESGTSRVSASRLSAIASALGTHIHWFFDGASGRPATTVSRPAFAAHATDSTGLSEIGELISLWPELTTRQGRTILQLARDLSHRTAPVRDSQEA